MIVLFTDYGLPGPYLGQVKAVLHTSSSQTAIIDLIADLPRQNPKASAYLLAACHKNFPIGTIFFCVIDPGVGSFIDNPVVIKLDDLWFVGPDNGIFDIVTRQSKRVECWKINWRPEKLSATFHGRDLYAPVCAMIANGLDIPGEKIKWKDNHKWPDDLNEIIYIDNFGNCMTGIRDISISIKNLVSINGHDLTYVTTYSDTDKGQIFWYINSNDLVEIAINGGNAAETLALEVGHSVTVKAN
jgi:S-adenosyl-L-methionine hydrolase (adenosine-forming)